MQKDIEYFGYQLKRKVFKPQPKKIEEIQRMQPPKNVT